MGRRVFNLYDCSRDPPVLVGSPSGWDTHSMTAEDAARARAFKQLGHENFKLEEVDENSLVKKTERFIDRLKEMMDPF